MEIKEKLHESLIPLSRNRSIRLIVKTFVRREKLINSRGINDKLRGDIGKSARLNYAALNASRDLGSNFNDSTRDLDDLLRRKGDVSRNRFLFIASTTDRREENVVDRFRAGVSIEKVSPFHDYDRWMCSKDGNARNIQVLNAATFVRIDIYIYISFSKYRATSRYVNQSYLSERILELFGFMEYEHYPWNLSWQLAIMIRSDRCVFIASDCITEVSKRKKEASGMK